MEWVRERASVHLVVPSINEKAPYIYYEAGNNFTTDDASPELLEWRLRDTLSQPQAT